MNMKKYHNIHLNCVKSIVVFLVFWGQMIVAESYTITPIVKQLNHPWSLVFLPNHDILITEKPGVIRIIRNGQLLKKNVTGVPEVVFEGQGGLMDIVLHPQFKKNRWLYLSFSAKKGRKHVLKVVRYRFKNDRLLQPQQIFVTEPARRSVLHYGGRLLFLPDQTLLITHGDGYRFRNKAQSFDTHFGKIIRVNDDGSIPRDNPFKNLKDPFSKIWSYGHRNPQGLVYDPIAKQVFSHEHGPKGGDELNIIEKGKNYGWPAITYGIDYNGSIISPFTEKIGMEQPIRYWVPSIALSGMTYYNKSMFKHWQGSLFITGLVSRNVQRVKIVKHTIIESEILFSEIKERLRDIKTAPDGSLMILTDGRNARLLKISKPLN